jgi:hypothetical protein
MSLVTHFPNTEDAADKRREREQSAIPTTNAQDATYQGIYAYPADAISSTCGKVGLKSTQNEDRSDATDYVIAYSMALDPI